jgi:hypothetical protein
MSPSRHSSKSFGGRRRKTTRASYAALAEGVLLQPWFLPQRTTLAIHSLVPADFWKKMRNVFDDYGCIVCGAETHYHSNGMCSSCYKRTREKVLASARRHARHGQKLRLDLELFRQEKLARKLLARFAVEGATSPKNRRIGIVRNNPVYVALAAKLELSRKPI